MCARPGGALAREAWEGSEGSAFGLSPEWCPAIWSTRAYWMFLDSILPEISWVFLRPRNGYRIQNLLWIMLAKPCLCRVFLIDCLRIEMGENEAFVVLNIKIFLTEYQTFRPGNVFIQEIILTGLHIFHLLFSGTQSREICHGPSWKEV